VSKPEPYTDERREKDVNRALRSVRAQCNAWAYATLDAEIRRLRRLVDPSRSLGLHDEPPAAEPNS
jgi:hypothetical protein